jgi:integrase
VATRAGGVPQSALRTNPAVGAAAELSESGSSCVAVLTAGCGLAGKARPLVGKGAGATADVYPLDAQVRRPASIKTTFPGENEAGRLQRGTTPEESTNPTPGPLSAQVTSGPGRPARQDPQARALDQGTWLAVVAMARERLAGSVDQALAARDLAVLEVLGGAGLRSAEARALTVDSLTSCPRDGTPRLRVSSSSQDGHERVVPVSPDVHEALATWLAQRRQISELRGCRVLFPRLGRRGRDGGFPLAGGPLTRQGLGNIVRAVMLGIGLSETDAQPNTLRRTFTRLYIQQPGAELTDLQYLLGHSHLRTTIRQLRTQGDLPRRTSGTAPAAGDHRGP